MNTTSIKALESICAKSVEAGFNLRRNPEISAGEQLKVWASTMKNEEAVEWLREQVKAVPWVFKCAVGRDTDLHIKATAFTPMPRKA